MRPGDALRRERHRVVHMEPHRRMRACPRTDRPHACDARVRRIVEARRVLDRQHDLLRYRPPQRALVMRLQGRVPRRMGVVEKTVRRLQARQRLAATGFLPSAGWAFPAQPIADLPRDLPPTLACACFLPHPRQQRRGEQLSVDNYGDTVGTRRWCSVCLEVRNTVAQYPGGWTPDGNPETWPMQFPEGSRVIIDVPVEDVSSAATIAGQLQANCRPIAGASRHA